MGTNYYLHLKSDYETYENLICEQGLFNYRGD